MYKNAKNIILLLALSVLACAESKFVKSGVPTVSFPVLAPENASEMVKSFFDICTLAVDDMDAAETKINTSGWKSQRVSLAGGSIYISPAPLGNAHEKRTPINLVLNEGKSRFEHYMACSVSAFTRDYELDESYFDAIFGTVEEFRNEDGQGFWHSRVYSVYDSNGSEVVTRVDRTPDRLSIGIRKRQAE